MKAKSKRSEVAEMVPGRDLMMLFVPMNIWLQLKRVSEYENIPPADILHIALNEYEGVDHGKEI
jgi:hypothetical protein